MSKLLISADLHIHPHKKSTSRLQDCLNALEWIFKTSHSENIDKIVFAGDLFHDRQKIDILTYQRTFELFQKYVAGQKSVYLLLGNHDLWHYKNTDISSVYPLSSIEGVSIIYEPSTIDIYDFPISFLPYTNTPEASLSKIKNNSKNKVLFGHVAIDGAIFNVMHNIASDVSVEHDGDMKKVGPEIFSGWDQVFLGHYHSKQELKNKQIDGYCVEYVGSPLQLSFGEAFQHKEIVVYDLDTQDKTYIRNKFSPQHFIGSPEQIKKYPLENNFIRVVVEDIGSSNLIDMRTDLLNNNNIGTLEIKLAPKKKEQQEILDAKCILYKEDEMLSKYIEEVEKNGELKLDKDKLLKIGNLICTKGEKNV